jgi:Xaa-Pro aminopeptidase
MSLAGDALTTGRRRVLELQQAVRSLDLSGILLHKPENIYYFSGVSLLEASFLIVPETGEPELIVAQSGYHRAVRDSLLLVRDGGSDLGRTVQQRLLEKGCLQQKDDTLVKSLWRYLSGKILGVEYDFLNLQLKEQLQVNRCRDIVPVIREMRMIKDRAEIAFIAEAGRIADEALQEAASLISLGMTESEVSGIIEHLLKAKGADESRVQVRSGENTVLAFNRRMSGEIVAGPLLINCGAGVRGYWSEITRTFYLGGKPDPRFSEIYLLVLEGFDSIVEHLQVDNSIYEAAFAAYRVFAHKGYDRYMFPSVGYGIGLEIRECPGLSFSPDPSGAGAHSPDWYKLAQRYAGFVEAATEGLPGPNFQQGQVFTVGPGIGVEQMGVGVGAVVLIGDKPQLLTPPPGKLEDVILG